MLSDSERQCRGMNLKMNAQRRAILDVIDGAKEHLSVEEIHERVRRRVPMNICTVYRNIKLLTRAGILTTLEIGDRKTRYETAVSGPHEHLIDVRSGKVVEFTDAAIAGLVETVAAELGYRLVNYKLDLFAEPKGT